MEQYLVQFPKLGLSMTVSREAVSIGGFVIYWYAVLIAVGTILAVIYALKSAKSFGVNSERLTDIAIAAIFFGMIGARVYYVLFNLKSYQSFVQMINIRDGGLAIYGAIIFGVLAGFITSRINKTHILPVMDIAAGGLLIGQAIGRWGNFVNQEAFGVNTSLPFGMFSSKTESYLESVEWDLFKQGIEVDPSAPVHPCFLYESIWCIIGFVLILLYKKHRKFDGELFLFYAAWYGTGRAMIEGLRTDSLMIGPLRVSQILSVVVAIAAVVLIVVFRVKKARSNDPDYLKLYVLTEESRAQFLADDEKALGQAEQHLDKAQNTLDTAQQKLDALLPAADDTAAAETQTASQQDSEAVQALIDRQIDLALTHLSLASGILDGFDSPPEDAAEEPDTPEVPIAAATPEEVLSLAERLQDNAAQIVSARDYLAECAGRLSAVRTQIEKKRAEKDTLHALSDDLSDPDDGGISSLDACIEALDAMQARVERALGGEKTSADTTDGQNADSNSN